MTRSDRSGLKGGWRVAATLAASVAALLGLLLPLLFDSPANAAGLRPTSSTPSCTTYPAGDCTTTTTASSTTSTTGVSVNLTLTASYSNGVLRLEVCGFPAAATGTTVHFYVNGTLQTETGVVQSNGCTTLTLDPTCLPASVYQLVAVDQPYGEATLAFTVTRGEACTAAASTSRSTLAFTGANILKLLVIAGILIVLGYAIVRLNRLRRRAN